MRKKTDMSAFENVKKCTHIPVIKWTKEMDDVIRAFDILAVIICYDEFSDKLDDLLNRTS